MAMIITASQTNATSKILNYLMLNPDEITNLVLEVTAGDDYETVKYEGIVRLPMGTLDRIVNQ